MPWRKGLRVDRGRMPQLLGADVKIGRFKEGHQALKAWPLPGILGDGCLAQAWEGLWKS